MKYELNERYLSIEIESLYESTIQEFFDDFVPSKKIQHLLIQNKWINMDGNPVKRETDIVGLKLNINLYPEDHEYKVIENHELSVVYEDEFLVVVNKPKGLLVHSDGEEETTLTDIVESYYADKPYICPQPLHRLDRETCGMVVYSKSIIFQPLFDKLLSEKQIRRNYLAFVSGTMYEDESLVINKAIGKDRHNANKRVIYKDGQPALTKVRSLGTRKGISILRCTLDTGRTHQIRVHLASEKLPILNDDLYGVESDKLRRMGLIASELDIYHPFRYEEIHLECDLPRDMEELTERILG